MRNLEKRIYRQRLIIEGKFTIKISEATIRKYLIDVAKVTGMTLLTKPLIFSPNEREHPVHHGIAGFVAWVESGCSVYTWDYFRFFTVEIYTCKKFDPEKAVQFTRKFFKSKQMVYRDM